MKINTINNVNNTLNQISFKAGVQTNYGMNVPSAKDNIVEGNLFTGFVGTIAPLFNKIQDRAESIEKGLNQAKIDYLA